MLVAGAALFLLRDDATTPESSVNVTVEKYRKTGPPSLAAGGERAEPTAAADESQKPEPSPPARPRYRGPLHVHGRVVAPKDVGFGPDARVHVVIVEGEPEGAVLARSPLDAFGTFDFHAKADTDVSIVRVVASLPGFVTATADAEPSADGDVAVDVRLADELKRGWTCKARVVDESGKPIAGLPVFVEASWYAGTCIALARLDPSLVLGAGDHGVAQGLRGTGVTDAEGRFSIRGLQCGGCSRARSGSPDWFLLEDEANRTLAFGRDQGERTLTAWRAATLHLTVIEEGTGKPLDRFEIRAVPEGGTPWSWQGRDGRLDVGWPRSSESVRVALDFSVSSQPDFAPESSFFIAEEGKAEITAGIVLHRNATGNSGRVTVRVAGRGASLVDREPQPVSIALRRPRHRSVGTELRVELDGSARAASGLAAGPFDIAEGGWNYEIEPALAESALLAEQGSILVVPGKDAEITWHLPALGSIAVRGRAVADGTEGKTVLLRSTDGREVRASLRASMRLPVGSWTATVFDAGGAVLGAATATIEEDKETTVRVGDE